MTQADADITGMLFAWRDGDRGALDRLLPLVYRELRALARRRRRGRAGETMDTTALVHEAYLRLVDQTRAQIRDRGHFFAVAARAMRQIAVDHARARLADKRGGGRALSLSDVDPPEAPRAEDIVAVDEALHRLEQIDERLPELVELRFFAGLSVEETAAALGLSPRTVKRDWRRAKALLYLTLRGGPSRPPIP
jgi:RNA polymerase sigma factor (TIGR02999 family)